MIGASSVPSTVARIATPPEGASALLAGRSLGPYRVVSRLAMGGMAELWLANRTGRDGQEQDVVLKTMRPGVAESRDLVAMFENEAAIGFKLNHPNLIRVLDYGRLEGRFFIAMEHVDGLSLRQLGARFEELGQRFPPRLLLGVMMHVCRGLHAAHELRDRHGPLDFIHRDVSPENIMVTPTGGAKLIDFGAAIVRRRPTSRPRFVGKFRYVAPERIEGWAEDRRVDIYALGAILYEYLTGTLPFEGNDDLTLVSLILEGQPTPPEELVPTLLPELARITSKALAARANERYKTAAELASDLLPLLDADALAPPAEEIPKLLRAAFAKGGPDEGGEHEHDTKTVEMEVSALAEALRRTREEPTVVKKVPARKAAAPEMPALPEMSELHESEVPLFAPPPPPVQAPAWLFEPTRPGVELPSDGRGTSVFDVRRADLRRSDLPAPGNDGPPPAPGAPPPEAARRFDRGLELLHDKLYASALAEWEAALELAPGHRTYQVNLKRLRERVQNQEPPNQDKPRSVG